MDALRAASSTLHSHQLCSAPLCSRAKQPCWQTRADPKCGTTLSPCTLGRNQRRNIRAAGHGRRDSRILPPDQFATVSVDPSPPREPAQAASSTQSWLVKAALAAVLLVSTTRLIGVFSKKRSQSDLEARGYLDASRDQNDPYLEDIMANVKKTQYEELSEDQIATARRRRSRARGAKDVITEDDIEIPDNHPFAQHKKLTEEDEELIKQRLGAKRGRPQPDLESTRAMNKSQPKDDTRQ